jgi:Zinc knuckle
VRYISALNTRRNPDLLVPGGKFLKGNQYFKGNKPPEASMDEKASEEEVALNTDAEGDLEFDKLMQHSNRYFLGENPLLRCKNCGESGHWARGCPNETKRAACILCGKDTHDSFSCTEKICFKCNKVGHLAINCIETNIIKCNRCGLNGHKELRCLKVWRGGPEYSQTQLNFLRCIECGKQGHLKCTKEKMSAKIPIDTKVREDLDEFLARFAKKSNTSASKLNIKKYVGASDDEDDDEEISD